MGKKNDICEAKIANRWTVLSIADVLALDPRPMLRCLECHGSVRAHNQANNGMRAHFEHFVRHDGCSLKHSFNGKHTRHPDALE